MLAPYLVTVCPLAMGAMAALCPKGIGSWVTTATPGAAPSHDKHVPEGRSLKATTTLSSGLMRNALTINEYTSEYGYLYNADVAVYYGNVPDAKRLTLPAVGAIMRSIERITARIETSSRCNVLQRAAEGGRRRTEPGEIPS
jgi:hypothetical protein